jgi:hypothetical protein
MTIQAHPPCRAAARLSHALAPLVAIVALVAACATPPPPPSRSAADPSNPSAEETPAMTASVTSAEIDAAASPVVYACPMHPEVTSTQPGQKCPKCGMALVPRRATP